MDAMKTASIISARQRSTSESRFAEAIAAADALYQAFHTQLPRSGMLGHLRKVLAALPLGQNDYALLYCRIANADRYDQEGERHAAAYEIRLLAKRLRAEFSRTVP
jgi:hypothetical protein